MAATSAPPPDANEFMKSLSSTITFKIVHPEIIYTYILPHLDGVTLTLVASVSSLTHRLCTKKDLWRKICATTWPSLLNPTACRFIFTFPSSYHFEFFIWFSNSNSSQRLNALFIQGGIN
ncbi:hypothetical protein VNO77_00059 [Canavalia gladiata]|uniref:F-box domain-containing protein n=1 Tax=Canavalia gladiata TaxID=3824 RepID=A0AAN9MTF2_CANGL